RILGLQLGGWGISVRAGSSGIEALSCLHSEEILELALLDMQMPMMDGRELAGRIRALPGRENLPLVMLSSLGRSEAEVASIGFAAHVCKPVKSSALYEILSTLFSSGPDRSVDFSPGTPRELNLVQPPSALAPRTAALRVLLVEDNI